MYQRPSVPRTIGGVLDDTFQLYKAAFSASLTAAVLMSLCTIGLSLYQVSTIPSTASTGAGLAGLQAVLTRMQPATPLSGFVSLLVNVVELLLFAVLLVIGSAVSRGESAAFGEACTAALRRMPAMIGAILVYIVAGIIAALVLFLPIIYVVNKARGPAAPSSMSVLLVVLVLVGIVLVFVLLYVLSRLQLFTVPLVTQQQGPLQSLGTSWRLVGGNWWRTTTTVFVISLVAYIVTIVVVAIGGAVSVVATGVPTNVVQGLGRVAVVGAVTGGVVRIVTAPLMAAAYIVLYQDLVLRKGGGDLEARLGALPKG